MLYFYYNFIDLILYLKSSMNFILFYSILNFFLRIFDCQSATVFHTYCQSDQM